VKNGPFIVGGEGLARKWCGMESRGAVCSKTRGRQDSRYLLENSLTEARREAQPQKVGKPAGE